MEKVSKLFASNSNVHIDKTLNHFVRHLDSGGRSLAHAMSDLCKVNRIKSRNVATLLAAKFPPLPNDFGQGDMLISFRTMEYVQANIFVSAPYQTPKDGLFQRTTSFQDSFEEELKTHYATDDISRHPDYRTELQTLLSTYYKELLGIAGASEGRAPRILALASTPKKPLTSAVPEPAVPASAVPTPAAQRRRPPHRKAEAGS